MKRLIWGFTCAVLVVAVCGVARADWSGSYIDLISRAEYEPSSDIPFDNSTYYDGLGGDPAGPEGGIGYQLSDFQLNLLYQAYGSMSISDTRADIEAFDDWRYAPLGDGNFPDGEVYFLRIDTDGYLPIGNWGSLDGTQEYQADSGAAWAQWTISGWWDNGAHTLAEYHTILAGDIVGGDYLRVIGDYRSFGNEVNPVEIFEGAGLLCEVAGYTLDLSNGLLEVSLTPEPGTITLLGLGLVGLITKRRNRR